MEHAVRNYLLRNTIHGVAFDPSPPSLPRPDSAKLRYSRYDLYGFLKMDGLRRCGAQGWLLVVRGLVLDILPFSYIRLQIRPHRLPL